MRLLSLVLLLIFSNPAFADEKTTMFYGGFGQADDQLGDILSWNQGNIRERSGSFGFKVLG